jgi:RNA polymerase sigma factor (sigma-70 family)
VADAIAWSKQPGRFEMPARSGRVPSSETIRLVPFERVVREHGIAVWRFCASQVGRERADDLFQETMLAALSAYPSLREPRRVRSWLLRIAARKAVDHHRERARAPVPVAEPDAGVAPAGPELLDDDLWSWVRALPSKQRQAVALRFVADMTYADIGQAMETSSEAARRSVFEGMKRLRRGLTSRRIDRWEPQSWAPR